MGERQCYPVAGDISLGELAFAEPLAVGAARGQPRRRSARQVGADHRRRHDRLRHGAGGAARRRAQDHRHRRSRPPARAGAATSAPTRRCAPTATRDALATPQFDVAYEVSGNFNALKTCVAATKRGGVVVQVGTLPHEPLPFVVNELMAKELDLRGAFRWGIEFDWAVDYLSSRRVDVRPLLSGQYPLQDAVAAFARGGGQEQEHQGAGRRVRLHTTLRDSSRAIPISARRSHAFVLEAGLSRPSRLPRSSPAAPRSRSRSSSGRTSTRRASRTTPSRCGPPPRSRSAPTASSTSRCSRRRTLGKETDINQGMTLGTVDMIISGPSFAARSYPRLGIALLPVHLPRRRPPDRLLEEPGVRGDGRRVPQEDRHPDHSPTRTTARARRRRRRRSPTAPA